MATYENTRLLVDGARGSDLGISRVAYRFVGFVTDLANAISYWNTARKTRNELSGLSDHALEDIGLTRGNINAFSIGRTYR